MSSNPYAFHEPDERPPERVPALNVPFVVVVLIAIFGITHWVRTSYLSENSDIWAVLNFALIPGCYSNLDEVCMLREPWAGLASPVAHAFLHGDWTHLGTNAIWLLAFGTPVARRLGAARFVIFCGIGALAGAATFFAFNPDLIQPMIGASGVVSALMGGAARFALGSMGRLKTDDVAFAPLLTIRSSLADRTVLFFIVIFFVTNLVIGSAGSFLLGGDNAIAWEAHVGGFLFGFLFFGLFDPRHQHTVSTIR